MAIHHFALLALSYLSTTEGLVPQRSDARNSVGNWQPYLRKLFDIQKHKALQSTESVVSTGKTPPRMNAIAGNYSQKTTTKNLIEKRIFTTTFSKPVPSGRHLPRPTKSQGSKTKHNEISSYRLRPVMPIRSEKIQRH